jgi:hypothetical protein
LVSSSSLLQVTEREKREGEKERKRTREIPHEKESFLDASSDLLLPFFCWTERERERERQNLREIGREFERVLGEK